MSLSLSHHFDIEDCGDWGFLCKELIHRHSSGSVFLVQGPDSFGSLHGWECCGLLFRVEFVVAASCVDLHAFVVHVVLRFWFYMN